MSGRHATRPCRGPNRRELLRLGLYGTLGLGLGDLLRLRAFASGGGPGRAIPVRAKRCILIWLAGGPSHLDTLDPKPDAPSDVRGEFKTIDTAVPGLLVSEVLPGIAGILGRATLVRSLTSPESDHDRATHHVMTGYRPSPALVYPTYPSVASRALDASGGALPPSVAVPDAPIGSPSGYLSPAFDPFAVGGDPNTPGFRVRDLAPPDRITLDRLRRRRAMVDTLDGFAADVGTSSLTSSRDQFSERAYDLLTSASAQSAFRIGDEPEANRARYGRTPVGQSCLLARRLVEAGVGFVTVHDRGPGQLGWDTHQDNFKRLRDTLAPPIDRAFSALVGDLDERGLLDDTLVVMMGEFGRTPRINGNAGRDHHGRANWALLAGGGAPNGCVIGRTDARGDMPTDRPVTPSDLAATIYTLLGIDPDRQFETPDGRPLRVVDGGKALPEFA